jgi:DNA-binding GntR family transcriptional regulator
MRDALADAPLRTVDDAYRELRRRIIDGSYAPGERLIEERIAGDLGISRTPVRHALARVAAEGLVRSMPNRGAVVRSFTTDDLIQTFELRALLEGHAAERAAGQRSADRIAELEQIQADLDAVAAQEFADQAEQARLLVEHNQRFHHAVLATSGNARLGELLPLVTSVPLQFQSFYWYSQGERQRSSYYHHAIIAAIGRRDGGQARVLMQAHIFDGRDFLLRSLAEHHALEGDQ